MKTLIKPYVIFGGSTLLVGGLTFFLRGTEEALQETTQETKKSKLPVDSREEKNLLS